MSNTVSVSKRGKEPQEKFASNQPDDVAKMIQRRLEGDPFGAGGSREIELKDKSLICRWFNGAKSSDRIWQAKHNLGWRDVREEMLVDIEQLGGYDLHGGAIARGERGQERLLCMPRQAYAELQMAKTRKNDEALGSSKRAKQDIEERAGAELGPQAADWVRDSMLGEVTDHIETVSRDE